MAACRHHNCVSTVRLPAHALTDGVLIRGGVGTHAMAPGLPLRFAGFVMETQTLALTHSPFVPVASAPAIRRYLVDVLHIFDGDPSRRRREGMRPSCD